MLIVLYMVFTLLLSGPARAVAERPFADYFHTAWSQSDGAPSPVCGIVQDADGWLWIGSAGGLYRFDGEHFELIEAVAGQTLHKSNISSLSLIDGALWIGYQFGGIEKIEKGEVKYFDPRLDAVPGAVFKLLKGPDGHMLAATGSGLYQLNQGKWSRLWPTDGSQAPAQYPFVLADKSLIFLGSSSVYQRVAGHTSFRKLEGDDRGIYALQEGANGSFLANSITSGYLVFDPNTSRFRQSVLGPTSWLFFLRDGSGWASDERGIHLLKDVQTLAKGAGLSETEGLSGKLVKTSFEDREGNFWLGTAGGIDRFRRNKVTTLPLDVSSPGIAAAAAGAVWVSTATTAPLLEMSAQGVLNRTTLTGVESVTRGGDGTIWAVNDEVIARLDGNAIQQWPLYDLSSGYRIQSIAQDRDGSIWASRLHQRGLSRFKDGKWEVTTRETGYKETAIFLYIDERNRLWQTYTGNRIALLDGNKVTRYYEKSGLRTDNVLSVFVRGEHVWVGGEKALMYLSDGKFHALLDENGKHFLGVSGIVETANGDLWVHGLRGISHIPAAELQHAVRVGYDARVTVEPFDVQDGVVGKPSQINQLPSLVEGVDHRIWFATVEGVGWVDPAHLRRNLTAPHVELLGLFAGDKSYPASSAAKLPAGSQNIRIDYTALGLSFPTRMRFRYRLDGTDTDWVDAGNRRSAYYSSMSPGTHRFSVIAANEDGVWNTRGASVQFTVLPKLTQTVWFRLLCAIAALVVLWLLSVLRLRQIIAKNQIQTEARIGERERIARELHDTLLQSVQGLVLKVHVATQRLPDEEPMRTVLDDALRNAEDVMVEGRNRVRQLRDYGEELSLAQMLRKLAQELYREDGPRIIVLASSIERSISQDVTLELYAIGREATLNALNHANPNEIQVNLNCGHDRVILTVSDDGCGLSDHTIVTKGRPDHWGMQGMRERAKKIGAAFVLQPNEGGGTLCTVSIPATLAYSPGTVVTRIANLLSRIRNLRVFNAAR